MLSLDQVRLLENRVEKAVTKIASLTTENEHLRSQLTTLQQRVIELEGFVSGIKDDQGKIEAGILNALEQLGALEHAITSEPVQEQASTASSSDTMPDAESATSTNKNTEPAESEPEQVASNTSDQDDGQIDIF